MSDLNDRQELLIRMYQEGYKAGRRSARKGKSMSDGIQLMLNEDGVAEVYDDTWDIVIHCENEKEFNEAKEKILSMNWIPVTERMPNNEQPILFSTTTGRVHQGRYHKDNSLNQWYSSLDKMRTFNKVVNAWMPLPKPYEGGKDE